MISVDDVVRRGNSRTPQASDKPGIILTIRNFLRIS